MISIQEYLFSVLLLFLSALSLFSKLMHWKDGKKALKSLGGIGIACAFTLFLSIVLTIKGKSPWSHLQKPLTDFVAFIPTVPPPAPRPPSPPTSDVSHKTPLDNALSKADPAPAIPFPSSRAEPKPRAAQHAQSKVSAKKNVIGNGVAGEGHVAGNNDQINTSSAPTVQINSAPNGIAIGGGTVVNPTVNNYGTPLKPDRTISDADRMQVVSYLSQNKAVISLKAPYGEREATNYAILWYGIFRDAGWEMKDRIVLAYMTVGGNPTPGAILFAKGEPGQPGEQITVSGTDPLVYVANTLKSQGVPIWLQRDPKQDDRLIIIQFGPSPD
jgi:hypothetical protein